MMNVVLYCIADVLLMYCVFDLYKPPLETRMGGERQDRNLLDK